MVRYLYPTDLNPSRTRKVDKMFENELGFKEIKFPIKILVMEENIYVIVCKTYSTKKTWKVHVNDSFKINGNQTTKMCKRMWICYILSFVVRL